MSDETVGTTLPTGSNETVVEPQPAASDAAAQRRRREPKIITPRGTPVGKCQVNLATEFAQRVFYRTWDRLKADLYVLTVRTRTAEQLEAAGALETLITESFDKARSDLVADMERTEVLRDHVKVRDIPDYEDRLDTLATFSTPRAREFLAIIQLMDQLLVLYDALWLAGYVETQERLSRSQNWQRRLVKVTNRIRELANRTRGQLSRQMDQRPPVEGAVPGQTDGASEVGGRLESGSSADELPAASSGPEIPGKAGEGSPQHAAELDDVVFGDGDSGEAMTRTSRGVVA
jgi:hypothetical protein